MHSQQAQGHRHAPLRIHKSNPVQRSHDGRHEVRHEHQEETLLSPHQRHETPRLPERPHAAAPPVDHRRGDAHQRHGGEVEGGEERDEGDKTLDGEHPRGAAHQGGRQRGQDRPCEVKRADDGDGDERALQADPPLDQLAQELG
uniref:Uncharacterized protein n=1 Tax=Triticum urartu TaxID=4572 RepID=A0A8R7PKP4_TRIUA